MMKVILYLYQKAKSLVSVGMPVSVLKQSDIFEKVIAMKYDVPNKNLEMFEEYMQAVDAFYDSVMESNG